ncbi:hypothetical protein BDY17DRAFT_35989 [Neohortaea acidophila]|uniref:Uncharacterized protein n=1 Tax=Neohortaea acidophila TaxID=245834 RepID=A0A6A6PK55_9PEZI|nr:uncharacterized protein BDY17DRAFT_35989 [Neohortaea acidophila]KAF2480315.1 hypothetical protein BDY17DRAFT_35989 [Neohortaea acidophila]
MQLSASALSTSHSTNHHHLPLPAQPTMSYPFTGGPHANHDQYSQPNDYVVTNTEPRMLLDFSDLFAPHAQIETYTHHSTGNKPELRTTSPLPSPPSTGNTPERPTGSPVCYPPSDADNEYSPSSSPPRTPMLSFAAQAQQHHSKEPDSLIEWLDYLFDDMDMSRALTRAEQANWKAVLAARRYPHSEFCGALLHAVGMIRSAEDDAKALNVGDEDTARTGFLTGMPLETIAWEKVDEDGVKRMPTFTVHSGILQACAELRRLRVVIARHGEDGPGEQAAKMDVDVVMSSGMDGAAEYSSGDVSMDISSGDSHY